MIYLNKKNELILSSNLIIYLFDFNSLSFIHFSLLFVFTTIIRIQSFSNHFIYFPFIPYFSSKHSIIIYLYYLSIYYYYNYFFSFSFSCQLYSLSFSKVFLYHIFFFLLSKFIKFSSPKLKRVKPSLRKALFIKEWMSE